MSNKNIDSDIIPFIVKLDYELVKSKGIMNGTRYRINKTVPKRHSSTNKNK